MSPMEWTLFAIAVIGAIWGATWQIVRRLQQFREFLRDEIKSEVAAELREFRDELHAAITTEVKAATEPLRLNGGKGLADVPERLADIHTRVADTNTRLDNVEHHVATIEDRQIGIVNTLKPLEKIVGTFSRREDEGEQNAQ